MLTNLVKGLDGGGMMDDVHTDKMLAKHYIGDRIMVKGEGYMVTGNYPRHGYLFGLPTRTQTRGNKSVKIYYGEPISRN